MKTKFSILTMPRRILSYGKIVKAERKDEGENEVFDLNGAEAHLVLSKDKQSQTNSGQEEIVKNCFCEKIPGKTMITRFSEEPGPFLR